MVTNIIVIKFGGSCLSTAQNINQAAKKISEEVRKNKKVVVVVSALTGVTDNLLKLATESSHNKMSKSDLDEILAMGERTSASLLTNAIKSIGIKAIGIDPRSEHWPIYTNSNFGDAEVRLVKTQKAVEKNIKPLLNKGFVIVIPGFIGVAPEQKITTLGRGGSDISAIILGKCLKSDEVIFVKDVAGILSADPKMIDSPTKIDELDAEEMFNLSSAGAKILHPKTMKYINNDILIRVVGFNEDLSKGTIIRGELGTELKISMYPKQLSMITIIGKELSAPKNLLKILSEVATGETKILGITMGEPSLLLYLETPGKDMLQNIHALIKNEKTAKAIHIVESLGIISIIGHALERTSGIINDITTPLAEKRINLYGLLTISSSVRVVIDWKDREKALALIKKSLASIGTSKRG